MLFLELPLDILKIVISLTVTELGLNQSMKARLTCRVFAKEILEAVIETRVIEEVASRSHRLLRIEHHHDVTARYLDHRVRTDGSVTHPWIATIRETCRLLAQYTNSEHDVARVELYRRNACLCLALNAGRDVYDILVKECTDRKKEFEGSDNSRANCLTIAAWMGDGSLVESLTKGMDRDPLSFFGRASWAAAAQGHADLLQLFLHQGALPYNPDFVQGPRFELSKSPLAVAAYMGHENIIRLYIQHYCPEIQQEEFTGINYAAKGNQPTTLHLLLEHHKRTSTVQEYQKTIDVALIRSSGRGAPDSLRILLDHGVDVNASLDFPLSCLQYAAIAGDTQTVKLLLDAGASLEPMVWNGRTRPSALKEASRRDNHALTKLISDKHQELSAGGS
ncbi:hypothetical protein HYFRA_00011917 [Hymenoscyphus fraxineus]|uniref:Ankyrin n=1 Tax=Hymenoscyphus fraxineus TaxID=746836 RepID=A0A9N9KYZ2_9HELO|nr:hypothetical protein HYFRA_00011917 [Hymenoscyphus fraxineus]